MRLNDRLITSFIYNEQEFNINLAYDIVLDTFDVLEDDSLRDHEKAEINVTLLTGETLPSELSIELWNHIYKKYVQIEIKRPIEYDRKGNPMPVQKHEEQEQAINFDKDGEFIYASFQQAYGMNLYKEQGKLSWQEFQALLNGLPSDTIMQRIIQIRLWKPSKGETNEYKQQMKDLQKIYALEGVDE